MREYGVLGVNRLCMRGSIINKYSVVVVVCLCCLCFLFILTLQLFFVKGIDLSLYLLEQLEEILKES